MRARRNLPRPSISKGRPGPAATALISGRTNLATATPPPPPPTNHAPTDVTSQRRMASRKIALRERSSARSPTSIPTRAIRRRSRSSTMPADGLPFRATSWSSPAALRSTTNRRPATRSSSAPPIPAACRSIRRSRSTCRMSTRSLASTCSKAQCERSYIRYVDLVFESAAGLSQLISEGRIHLTRYSLAGTNGVNVSLAGKLKVIGNHVIADFGTNGIGGNRNSSAGDGYYRLYGRYRPQRQLRDAAVVLSPAGRHQRGSHGGQQRSE